MAKITGAGAAYCNEETGHKWGLKVWYDNDTHGWLFFDTMGEMSDARDEIDRKLWGGRQRESLHRDLAATNSVAPGQWLTRVQESAAYWKQKLGPQTGRE